MNGTHIELRRACGADLPAIVALLERCALPTGDLNEALLAGFSVAESRAESGSQLAGVIGWERLGDAALLRSLAVVPARRGAGLAARLVDWSEATARAQGAATAYLLTTTAADYFLRRGYAEVARAEVPPAVAGHAQFRSLCPASARCLARPLG